MEVTIRKATHQDREALCEIHVSSIRELDKSHYSEAEVDAGFQPGQKCKHRFIDGGELDCVPMKKLLERNSAEQEYALDGYYTSAP